jgi:hypothetical protein
MPGVDLSRERIAQNRPRDAVANNAVRMAFDLALRARIFHS